MGPLKIVVSSEVFFEECQENVGTTLQLFSVVVPQEQYQDSSIPTRTEHIQLGILEAVLETSSFDLSQ